MVSEDIGTNVSRTSPKWEIFFESLWGPPSACKVTTKRGGTPSLSVLDRELESALIFPLQ
jgi:hypothetical protein